MTPETILLGLLPVEANGLDPTTTIGAVIALLTLIGTGLYVGLRMFFKHLKETNLINRKEAEIALKTQCDHELKVLSQIEKMVARVEKVTSAFDQNVREGREEWRESHNQMLGMQEKTTEAMMQLAMRIDTMSREPFSERLDRVLVSLEQIAVRLEEVHKAVSAFT